jgi:hypothetical protein
MESEAAGTPTLRLQRETSPESGSGVQAYSD